MEAPDGKVLNEYRKELPPVQQAGPHVSQHVHKVFPVRIEQVGRFRFSFAFGDGDGARVVAKELNAVVDPDASYGTTR